jgi:hypothetical protein
MSAKVGLVVDEPTDLPDGTEVDLLPLDPGDWLDGADRAALDEALQQSEADVAAGRLIDAREVSFPFAGITILALSRERCESQLREAATATRRSSVCSAVLCRYLLEGECGNAGPVTRVFDGNAANVPFSIDIQESVLVEITSLGDFCGAKLYVQGIGVLEVFDLHGLKELSKNALWTVSRSAKSITLKCFPPMSGIGLHLFMRPSA